jgi:hypothetical protein
MTENELRELNEMQLEISCKKRSLSNVVNVLKRTELDRLSYETISFRLDSSDCELNSLRTISFLNTEKDILVYEIDRLEDSFKTK